MKKNENSGCKALELTLYCKKDIAMITLIEGVQAFVKNKLYYHTVFVLDDNK